MVENPAELGDVGSDNFTEKVAGTPEICQVERKLENIKPVAVDISYTESVEKDYFDYKSFDKFRTKRVVGNPNITQVKTKKAVGSLDTALVQKNYFKELRNKGS